MTNKSIDNYLKLEPKDFIPIYGFARFCMKNEEEPEWKTMKELHKISLKHLYTSTIMGTYHIALPSILIWGYGDSIIKYISKLF